MLVSTPLRKSLFTTCYGSQYLCTLCTVKYSGDCVSMTGKISCVLRHVLPITKSLSNACKSVYLLFITINTYLTSQTLKLYNAPEIISTCVTKVIWHWSPSAYLGFRVIYTWRMKGRGRYRYNHLLSGDDLSLVIIRLHSLFGILVLWKTKWHVITANILQVHLYLNNNK